MKKILFLTDFSNVAKNAFIYALSLAEKMNAEVHILHIVPIVETKDPAELKNVHPLAKIFNDTLEDEEWGRFKAEARKLEKIAQDNNKLKIQVEFHFEKGIFLDTITDYIYEKAIDIVVMGTSGANTIDKKLFGSNTSKLINHIDIPFLAVPEKAVFVAMNKVTIAVMLNTNEHSIILQLLENSLKYNYRFNCVHVVESEKMAAQAENKKRIWLENIGNDNLIVDTVVDTDVEKGLENYIAHNGTDILCIIHRNLPYLQRLFKLNHSNRLLQNSKTALLIYNNKS
ncbi:universal stress protein [Flavobacterium sp. UBA6135]|jgi:nucleotide-binding universal stress UspA family protein|uniref:universal stress protein n=1 Tax=Flavobacterium sp. UBA6135 TaxID=1946553 RepID=UPI0025C07C3A|nr:universal stress protein [Flavobacterium sp. UBA6135]